MSKLDKLSPEKAIAITLAQLRLAKLLKPAKTLMSVLCYSSVGLGIWLKFTGGRSEVIIFLGLFGGSLGVLSYITGKYLERVYARAAEVKGKIEEAERFNRAQCKAGQPEGKILLSVGFANLVGESMAASISEDVQALSGIFSKSVVVPVGKIPSAEVLFVYASLEADGTLSPDGKSGIRQIVQLTNASIVVVASPNSAEKIQKAIALPGPKTANIVFTVSRNEQAFGRFFRHLFEKMQGGKDMLSAWVELAPQVPGGSTTNTPQTLLIAEAGKISFPR